MYIVVISVYYYNYNISKLCDSFTNFYFLITYFSFLVFAMSNITKFEFIALDISSKNYLVWTLDAEIHLDTINLRNTVKEGNKASLQDRTKALIFLRHNLREALKAEYLTIKDPFVLWQNLKERYDHQKTLILPYARYKWMHLRL